MDIVYLSPAKLKPYEKNAKKHPSDQVEHIANSIKEFGFRQPIVIDSENVVIIGHGRLLAAQRLGLDSVPCVRATDLTEAQVNALRLADNKTNESEWDFLNLEEELATLELDFNMADFGFEPIADLTTEDFGEKKGSLAEKYLVPPFSVIYANKPYWLARKRAWVDTGLRSELGRGGDLLSIQGAIQRQTSYTDDGMIKQTKTKDMALKNNTISRMLQMKGK